MAGWISRFMLSRFVSITLRQGSADLTIAARRSIAASLRLAGKAASGRVRRMNPGVTRAPLRAAAWVGVTPSVTVTPALSAARSKGARRNPGQYPCMFTCKTCPFSRCGMNFGARASRSSWISSITTRSAPARASAGSSVIAVRGARPVLPEIVSDAGSPISMPPAARQASRHSRCSGQSRNLTSCPASAMSPATAAPMFMPVLPITAIFKGMDSTPPPRPSAIAAGPP